MEEPRQHDSVRVIGKDQAEVFDLTGDEVVIGGSPLNGIPLAGDRTVSRLHAALRRYPSGWSVRDLGSRNGTYVNGERVFGEQRLFNGDEIRVGSTILAYRSASHRLPQLTVDTTDPPPDLTRRELDVLTALCRPLVAGNVFTSPADVAEIAKQLVVTEAAVRQHLGRLYRKFGIDEGPSDRRRAALASVAINRGAITLGKLRDTKQD